MKKLEKIYHLKECDYLERTADILRVKQSPKGCLYWRGFFLFCGIAFHFKKILPERNGFGQYDLLSVENLFPVLYGK